MLDICFLFRLWLEENKPGYKQHEIPRDLSPCSFQLLQQTFLSLLAFDGCWAFLFPKEIGWHREVHLPLLLFLQRSITCCFSDLPRGVPHLKDHQKICKGSVAFNASFICLYCGRIEESLITNLFLSLLLACMSIVINPLWVTYQVILHIRNRHCHL